MEWLIRKDDGGITLHRGKGRMSWVPEKVTFARKGGPLRFERTGHLWPEGTRELAAELDRLKVPVDASVKKAGDTLRGSGGSAPQKVLSAAVRYRRNAARNAPEDIPVTQGRNGSSRNAKSQVTGGVTPDVTPRNDSRSDDVTRRHPLGGGVTSPGLEEDPEGPHDSRVPLVCPKCGDESTADRRLVDQQPLRCLRCRHESLELNPKGRRNVRHGGRLT